MKRVLCVFIWFLSLAMASAYAGEAETVSEVMPSSPQKRTVAILCVDGGLSQDVADRLMVQLQDDPGISFVERARFELISDELVLALAGMQAADTIELGELVGADALVLLARKYSSSGEVTRLLVCDCATGTRLGQSSMPVSREDVGLFADTVRAVLARFPRGVESVLTVSDFICRDLEYHYSHLQKDVAELLREALSERQGLAIVEIDEARAIAAEMVHREGDVSRIAQLNVLGEYRTDRLAEGGPRIFIDVSMQRGGRAPLKLASGSIPIDQAGQFVLEEIQERVLSLLAPSTRVGIDLNGQFEQLIARADQFAEVGDSDRAGALREAAILLRPGDDTQRICLVRDYLRWIDHPVEVWPKGAERKWEDPFYRDLIARIRATWHRALFHVEYLVRNRRVRMDAGVELFDGAISCFPGIRGIDDPGHAEEEKYRKAFLSHVGPALFRLEGHQYDTTTYQWREEAARVVMESAFHALGSPYLKQEDLEFIGGLLCEILPEDMPAPMVALYRLDAGPRLLQDRRRENPDAGPDAADMLWMDFATRLANSDRPLVRAYGEYALIYHRFYRDGTVTVTEDLLEDARRLLAFLETDALRDLDRQGYFRRYVTGLVGGITRELDRRREDVALRPAGLPGGTSQEPQAGPVPQPDGSLLCERVRLKPIEITLTSADGKTNPLKGHRWRAPGGYGPWHELVPAWEGTDVLYAGGALLFVGPDKQAREVLVQEDVRISRVVFDGKYVWASCGYGKGVLVIDRSGTVVAHIGTEDGLPTTYVDMPICALEPGRILAAGSIGQARRAWLATVALQGSGPRVNVFHEAIRTWGYGRETLEQILDPFRRFIPEWMVDYRDKAGSRWIVVGPRYRWPLIVDVDTLGTSVCGLDGVFSTFPRIEGPAGAFLSYGGHLYVGGSERDYRVFDMDPTTKVFSAAEERTDKYWHSGGGHGGYLIVHDGRLIYVGQRRWLRRNMDTGAEEVLLSNLRSLPDYRSGQPWILYNSSCFGLIARRESNLYQVSFDMEQPLVDPGN